MPSCSATPARASADRRGDGCPFGQRGNQPLVQLHVPLDVASCQLPLPVPSLRKAPLKVAPVVVLPCSVALPEVLTCPLMPNAGPGGVPGVPVPAMTPLAIVMAALPVAAPP